MAGLIILGTIVLVLCVGATLECFRLQNKKN